MPEWLLNKDNYTPNKEKDAFINKSILSILGVLTKLKLNMEYKANKPQISASVKLLSALALIFLISLSRSSTFLIVLGVFLLTIISLLSAEEIIYIFRTGALAAIFTLIILIPSIMLGNRNNSILIIFKVFETVSIISIISCTTKWSDITGAISIFRIPDIFIFVIDITMKYIMIFGEFSLNMLYALKLRSVGKNRRKNTSLGGIMGTMFLKSKEMTEEVYGAMQCRGFVGEYRINRKSSIKALDGLCILMVIGFAVLYIYFDRL